MIASDVSSERERTATLISTLLSFGKAPDDAHDPVASRLAALSDDLAARLPSRGYIRH